MCCSGGFFFFFNDTATTEIYTLSLHDALPISAAERGARGRARARRGGEGAQRVRRRRDPLRPRGVHARGGARAAARRRSEEHRLNSSHANISYAVFCLKKKNMTSVLPSERELD